MEKQLKAELEQVLAEKKIFLEQLRLVKAGRYSRLEVVVDLWDGPGLMDSSAIVEATHLISTYLDEHDPIKGQYNLEVSTAGAERILVTARHFRRAQDRLITLTLENGKEAQGRVILVDEDGVLLEQEETSVKYLLNEIKSARMLLEF